MHLQIYIFLIREGRSRSQLKMFFKIKPTFIPPNISDSRGTDHPSAKTVGTRKGAKENSRTTDPGVKELPATTVNNIPASNGTKAGSRATVQTYGRLPESSEAREFT